MGKTIRKDRRDIKYKEGQTRDRFVYRCKCNRCVGKNDTKEKSLKKEFNEQLKKIC